MNNQKQILQNIISFSGILYFFGFLVHNIFLAKFGIAQFDILRGRYIYIGFITILILLAIFIYMSILMNFKDISANFNRKSFFDWLGRIGFLPFIIYSQLNGIPQILEKFEIYFGKFSSIIFFIGWSILISIFFRILPTKSKFDEAFNRMNSRITRIVSIPLFFIIILFSINDYLFRDICNFIVFFGLLFWASLYGRKEAREGYFVKLTTSDFWDAYIGLFFLLISFLVILNFYSDSLYPNIPKSFGGGSSTQATIYMDKDSIKVEIIDETSNWITAKLINGDVKKFNSNQIKSIKYPLNKRKTLLK